MYSTYSTSSTKLSSQNLLDALYINSVYGLESFESLKIEKLPELKEVEGYLSNQTANILIQNCSYLEILLKDLEQYTVLYNKTKSYLNSLKLIFSELLTQKLS